MHNKISKLFTIMEAYYGQVNIFSPASKDLDDFILMVQICKCKPILCLK